MGETDRVVQLGSEAVRGGPLRMEEDSDSDWERSRSWAERKAGEETGADGGGGRWVGGGRGGGVAVGHGEGEQVEGVVEEGV